MKFGSHKLNLNKTMTISTSNGFCSKTLIYHSVRPPLPLPLESMNISVTDFIFSVTTTTSASLIDATTCCSIQYSDVPLPHLVQNLTVSLRQPPLSLTKGDTAYIISPNSSYLPILYLSLFAIGVTVSPANPVSSIPEVSRQIHLCKPTVTFATLDSIHKLLEVGFGNPIVLIDSPEFESMMRVIKSNGNLAKFEVLQSDTAAILYSSGTIDN
ncbi:AMP-dependent synthetase/ligase, AMP-binding enzyme C-terminal domain protein [Artemisia annua]|uniref:AMP-dependent synthetase/ligase, AMP-binding enzyme C-terminal domain protein n=1 Tax=Artemisia annua TaxID=35608 RepID=A0A2U1KH72_ARTAN|nr:AMP-dependent synthetase/ligase, AMP-binding enzyme C-terminal domain protein [Artemisia annua]